jgi:predicted Rossmann-fold nucleotide-binding protein
MNTHKIKKALTSALQLLNHEIVTEITRETKDEYLRVINEIVEALREFD